MTETEKQWIDSASYEDLLKLWRFAPVGSPWFIGETGVYYEKVMQERRKESDHVAASKRIGWDKP